MSDSADLHVLLEVFEEAAAIELGANGSCGRIEVQIDNAFARVEGDFQNDAVERNVEKEPPSQFVRQDPGTAPERVDDELIAQAEELKSFIRFGNHCVRSSVDVDARNHGRIRPGLGSGRRAHDGLQVFGGQDGGWTGWCGPNTNVHSYNSQTGRMGIDHFSSFT